MKLSNCMLNKLKVFHPLYLVPGDTIYSIAGIQSYVYTSPLNNMWRGYGQFYMTIQEAHESWIIKHYEGINAK